MGWLAGWARRVPRREKTKRAIMLGASVQSTGYSPAIPHFLILSSSFRSPSLLLLQFPITAHLLAIIFSLLATEHNLQPTWVLRVRPQFWCLRWGPNCCTGRDQSNTDAAGLTGLLSEHAPRALKDHEMKTVSTISLASPLTISSLAARSRSTPRCKPSALPSLAFPLTLRSIYQFLIAVRQQDGQMLMNESGEVTR